MQNPLSNDDTFYKQLFEHSYTSKLVIDPTTGNIVEANPAACAFYGYTYEQLTSKQLTDINTMSKVSIGEVMQGVISSAHMTFQTQHRLANGKICDVEVYACMIERDSKIYLYAIITDISVRKQTEKALHESESLYRLLAQNMPNSSVLMFDINMRYTLVEGPFLKRFGTVAERMIGKTPQEILPPEVVDFVISTYQRALSGEVFTYERTNQNYAYQAHATPVRNADGEIIGGMILTHDISEYKRLEDTLRQSEERLRLITDNIQDLVSLTDNQRKIVYVSPSFYTVLGYDPTSLLGRTPIESVHPDDREYMEGSLRQALKTCAQVFTVEIRIQHARGHYITVEAVNRLLYDAQSNFMGGIIVARDISERKQLEVALRQNEERLRLITDNIQDLVTQSDAQDRINFVGTSSRVMLGLEPEAMIGKYRQEFVHSDDWGKMIAVRQKAIEAGLPQIMGEGRIRHADGHYLTIETVIKLFYDHQSKYAGGVYVTRDISERKRLQELLIEREKINTALNKEQELSHLKSRMMERIAHEFRTPLAIIQASSNLLTQYYERLTPEKREQKAKVIKDQIQHITDMLDEIGLVIKGSFTPDHLDRVSTDLSRLCREIAAKLSTYFNRPDMYVLDVPESTIVSIDPGVLEDSLFHVMRNAARFSDPSDLVTIQLSRLNEGIELNVIDHGIGVVPDELFRIFEPFFRGTNIDERSGLGIGLAIAQAGISAHGGSITVNSILGQGTTVKIWLPA